MFTKVNLKFGYGAFVLKSFMAMHYYNFVLKSLKHVWNKAFFIVRWLSQ
jgi:hypothetical protein